MPPPSSRMTKNRAQPSRYRPGKAEVEDIPSEESSSEDEKDEPSSTAKQPAPRAASFPSQKKLGLDLSKAGQQRSIASTAPVYKKQVDEIDGFVTASESEVERDDEEEGQDSNSERSDETNSDEESDSSSGESARPLVRPTFISKAKRAQQMSINVASEAEKQDQAQQLRKEKADAVLQAQIDRDAALRAAGRKEWDDDDIAPEDEIDDTDGLDPEAEHAAWKLRELKRLRRDRLAIEAKEQEREEIERRRNLTAEEKEAEDAAYIAAQAEDRESRGKMGYMQKYFHTGAFFNDNDHDEDIRRVLDRDLAGARFTDQTNDKAVLPEYMRIRDMARLGKKGRTKYKDLKSEDTGNWGRYEGRKRDHNDLDDRFRPDNRKDMEQHRTGANTAPVGDRRQLANDNSHGREGKRARLD